MSTDREREERFLASLTPEKVAQVMEREEKRVAAMTPMEQVGNHLGEALTLLFDISNPQSGFADCTESEKSARMAYHHVHMAVKKLAKEHAANKEKT